jgi:hypothetical protein
MEAYPEPGPADGIHALIKFFVSLPPGVGGGLATIYDLAVPTPISKRRDAWIRSLGTAVDTLIKKSNDRTLETLIEDPEFVSFILEASHIAIKNHQEEKLTALQNALVNFYSEPIYDKKISIISIIDSITSTHLLILNFINDQSEILKDQIDSYDKLFTLFLENGSDIDLSFFRKCILDLDTHGLLRISKDFTDPYGGSGYVKNDQGVEHLKILQFGHELVSFIRETS